MSSSNPIKLRVLMAGPSPWVMGGISSVVQSYFESELIKKADIKYLTTHVDGNKMLKFFVALKAYILFLYLRISFKPNILHVHLSSYFSFYRKLILFALAKILRVKVLIHVHSGIFDHFYDSNRVHAFFIRLMLTSGDMVIALSKNWEKLLYSYANNARIRLLYNPVRTSLYSESMPWKNDSAVIRILFMGRIGKNKGAYDIIKAIPTVLQSCTNAKFIFAGDGDIDGATALCEKAEIIDHVEFPGWLRGEKKLQYFTESDIFMLPSYGEGIPVSVLEAMAAGLPVISTPVGGVPDAVENNVNGYIIDPGDIDAMARKIIDLSFSPDLRKQIGMANKRKCKSIFDVELIANKLLGIYEEMALHRIS